LKSFRRLFETGMPCLMYHKIGPRPRGVRIKGLYVNPELFETQLAELAEAGFATPAFGQLPAANNDAKTLAFTFDDGFLNTFKHALEPLARHRLHGIQFLVADRIGQFNEWEVQHEEVREPLMDATQIKEWIAAGQEIGAHSLTHPFLTRVSVREAREEIIAGKKKLEDMFGVRVRHFCYPYGDRNEAVSALVQEAGYETACTTDFGVNTQATDPFELHRIMVRHRSISIKAIKARLAE
jgi:peptidoglycan/xylan/chitin deacetylase (PgdA/CDA1 family)